MTTTVTQEQGYAGLAIKIPRVITTSTLAQVTTAGWWNNNPVSTNGQPGLNPQDLICICYAFGSTSESTAFFNVAISGTGVVTLSLAESSVILPVVSGHFANFSGTSGAIADDGYLPSNAAKTRVVMANGATIANHIATYTDITGTVGEDAGTAINGGNIQAGLSGTAGTLASFPATASNGSFIFAAINNAGGFNSTFSNSNIGQATVYSLPDPGSTTANIILSKNATVQHITSGSLQVDAGALISGLATGGFVGKIQLFPTTTTRGSLTWQATANSGDTATIFTTAAYGQASTITYPDPAVATAAGVLAPAALVNNNLVKASGTAGLIADAGITAASVSGAITQLGQLYQVSVTFNTAQMVTAYDTPLTIVANPLSSQMILVHFASVYTASTGHTAYATGTAPIIQYSSGGTNGQHGGGTIATAAGLVAGDITAAASQVRNLYGLATAALTGLSGLGIYFSNATGDYTAGTGTSVTITLVYELLTATV